MKILLKKIQIMAFALVLGCGVGACSTGTDSGETNVEESDAKDKNPNEHNVSGHQPTSTDSSNMETLDDAYEKTDADKGARDSDNDGMVDKPKQ
ncbi:hypothetical protein AAE02nite_02020 [Adhaeribacter aerolatus]|uniref:Lipoprotein n=1 Tax=Adhaeribacter aerolatus TaxID=670289 RepID=A0A512AS50_9BACT|nr:hypothetical protein [Adhaeribacter aerolatus]GEO02538.1 hypothetical protein AAE02nite_02020 [Adhaeribacter aerolatus]